MVVPSELISSEIKDKSHFPPIKLSQIFSSLWEDLAMLGLKHAIVLVVPAAAKQGQDIAQQKQSKYLTSFTS